MKSLIAKLEAAKEGQQEGLLLEAVTLAFERGWITEEAFERARQWIALGAYLDAALTLVPEGWRVYALQQDTVEGRLWFAGLDAIPMKIVNSKAASPALAFYAAALKARESGK